MGGFWERLIGSVKRCLKKIVGRSTSTFEEIRTLLVEIEGTLNNCPLTYLYDDSEGISQPFIPANLIYGRQIVGIANGQHFEVISTAQSLEPDIKPDCLLSLQSAGVESICWD